MLCALLLARGVNRLRRETMVRTENSILVQLDTVLECLWPWGSAQKNPTLIYTLSTCSQPLSTTLKQALSLQTLDQTG